MIRKLDDRLNAAPILDYIRKNRKKDYLSPLDAPPISPGHFALILVILLGLSGLGLTLFYNPTVELAASSLRYLHFEQPFGWLLHNSHRWSAVLLSGFVLLHGLRVFLSRAYRFPRDLNWFVGIGILLLVLLLGATGYLLRWDIKAFALMDLVVSSLSGIPFVGKWLVKLILGASELDVIPIYRGYIFHVWFLPAMLLLLLGLHLSITWWQGLAHLPSRWLSFGLSRKNGLPMFFLTGAGLLLIVVLLSAVTPHGDLDDPQALTILPHPDWLLMFYFLPFWFLKGSAQKIGVLIIPVALLVLLFYVPRLERKVTRRAGLIVLAVVGIVGAILLVGQISYMGAQVPLQGCNACHRATIIGGAPTNLNEFVIRNPDWVVFHLQDPPASLMVPFSDMDDQP
ncbi:MAG: cytochrome b N-terminal domain-containing protein [Anaerolineae bacterium]|nr:cytochrome b N-terminal domain-containing protein [Anaerolineae bacterium]